MTITKLSIVLSAALLLVACLENEGSAEQAGKEIDETFSETKQAVKENSEAIEEEKKDIIDEAREMVEEATARMQAQAE